MRTTFSLWLTTIILLTVLAFLAVFQPITFSPRKDPSDTSKYLRPAGVKVKNWDPSRPPDPYTSVGQMNIYAYMPQHDLRLGLDLRGGMHVVLQIPNRALFQYTLTTPLAGALEAEEKQQQFQQDLTAPGAGLVTPEQDASKLSIVVNENQVEVSTMAKSAIVARSQLDKINAVMAKDFAKGSYKSPDPENVASYYLSVDPKLQDNVRSIMERRVNPDGTKEVQAYNKGIDQVVLEIPGEKDPAHVEKLIGITAKLEFRLIPKSMDVSPNRDANGATNGVIVTSRGHTLADQDVINASYLVVQGNALKPDSGVTYDQSHQPAVSFSMANQKDRTKFGAITSEHTNEYLAIVLDNKIITAPVIKDAIYGDGIISGGFPTLTSAQDLATLLNAGALPVPVSIIENRTVSATLGAASVKMSIIAGLVGLLAVLIFMATYYRLPGLMADIALLIYICLSLGVMWAYRDFTLTLPGIAGVIIAIGMAVDANVIIFERLKEELRAQKPLETAIDVAFSRAWTAILDSNVASLITGSVLYALGTGAVRGFAVTLIIGVSVSMFTAVTVTRLLMKIMIHTKAGHNMANYGI